MLSVKLRYLDRWIEGRRAAAERYARLFAGTPVETPHFDAHEFAVFHLFVVRVAGREGICAALDEAGIDWGIHYPTPIHRQGAYRDAGIAPFPTPIADELGERILSLPMFAELTSLETERVAEVVLRAAKR
jgi:dTDP-4-amino-4,6-dideoxygalactose transaminase